jgi:hypothetical protein
MKDERAPGIFDNEPGVRAYVLVCLGGLLAIFAGLMERGGGLSILFPLIVGMLALIFRWNWAPIYLIFSVIWVIWAAARGLDLFSSVLYSFGYPTSATKDSFHWRPLADGIICLGVLLYSAGSYRLQGLVVNLFPVEPRRYPSSPGMRRGVRPKPRPRRTARLVSGPEIVRLLFVAAGCTGTAFLLWYWLGNLKSRLDPSPEHWRVMVLVWLFGVGLIVVASVLGYLGQRRMLPDEAALYLQDVVWRETPREQRRLMSWLAWARLRRKNREVQP